MQTKIPVAQIDNKYGLLAGAYQTVNGIPLLIAAHRGGANIHPENTMEAFRAVLSEGAKILEFDCHKLIDGTLGVMHDTTTNRTTTIAVNTADMSGPAWGTIISDVGNTLGGLYNGTTQKVPTFGEVVREFGNKVLMMPEAKNTGSGAAIVAVLQRYNIPTDAVIVQSFIQAELSAAIAAGYPTLLAGDALTPASVAAAGIGYVGVSSAVSGAYVASLVAAGLKVFVYTIDRHKDRDTFVGYGATGFFSNDPIYLSGTGYRLSTDPFASFTWYHGHLADSTSADRGTFGNTNRLQLANANKSYVLQGWASPIKGLSAPNNYTITLTMRPTALTATRWGGIAILDKDHDWDEVNNLSGQNGYHFLLRTEGTLQCYKVTNGVATQIGSDVATGALVANTAYTLTLTVTPTGLSLSRSGSASVLTNNDTTYRGAYLYFTQRVNPTHFSGVTIT